MWRERLRRSLRVRPEESRVVARVFLLMVLVWAGARVGATGVESLFFARFGPEHLPWMFVGGGLLTFPATFVLSGLSGRADPVRFFAGLALGMAVIAAAMWAALAAPGSWPYPALWLATMVLWIGHGTYTWGVAGLVHDARQAKRLFPLYGAGAIVGGALGGVVTAPLAAVFGAEHLLAVWAGSLVAASVLTVAITREARILPGRRSEEGFLRGVQEGMSLVGRSSLLRWMAASIVLLTFLYFWMSLPFADAVAREFPDEDRLAAFLGLLQGGVSVAALALSVVVAARLFRRVGVAGTALTFSVFYVLGFVVVAAWPSFGPLVGLRFLQLVWMFGVWQIAWQALFNVIPPEQRAEARTFIDGAAMPVGIVLSGFLLMAAQNTLTTRQLFLVAVPVTVGAVVAAVGARRSYVGAVAAALRAGRPDVFAPEVEPLGDEVWDRAAFAALAKGAEDPDAGTRRLTMEFLGRVGAPGTHALRLGGLDDVDPDVRAAALTALVRFPDRAAGSRALRLLADPEPSVRAAAVDAAVVCAVRLPEAATEVTPLLRDPDAAVRIRAAAALRRLASDSRAGDILEGMATTGDSEERAAAVAAMGETGLAGPGLMVALDDPSPAVRRAAVEAVARVGDGAGTDRLMAALGDRDAGVREAAARAVAASEPPPRDGLVAALGEERAVDGALMALARVGGVPPERIREVAVRHRDEALRWHERWRAVAGALDDRLRLLASSVRHRALRHATLVLRAQAAMGHAAPIEAALQSLGSRDPNQRANALEMVEAVADPSLVRPLLAVWDPEPLPSADPAGAVWEMIGEDDPWIRACAVLAATAVGGAEVRARLEAVAESDPHPMVRETAAAWRGGEEHMRTLTTMTLMDRVLALRRVPLFRELTPQDLQHVAGATVEHLYPDGTEIARTGEPGDALHVVVTGEVRVVRTGQDGGPVEVARLGPGYIVGEMAVLTEEPRTATLVAVQDVRTLTLDRARFQRILRERPDAALAVMRELCDRLRRTSVGQPAEADPG